MPAGIIEKAAGETYPVGLIYTAPDLEPEETIVSASISVSPAETGGLEAGTPTIQDGNKVWSVISAGLPGQEYLLTFSVQTSGGKIYCNPQRDSLLIRIL